MPYTPQTWDDAPSTATPVDASRLTYMENGIAGAYLTAASTVTGPDAFGAASAVGTSTEYARADHDHGLPSAPSGGSTTIGTTAGAPTSGTFSTGDTYLDSNYVLYVCTAGGTPGTWVQVAFDYAESFLTSNITLANTTYQNLVSVSLGAGTWDIAATATLDLGRLTGPANVDVILSPTSASNTNAYAASTAAVGSASGGVYAASVSLRKIVVLSSSTTVYLETYSGSAAGAVVEAASAGGASVANASGITAVKIG